MSEAKIEMKIGQITFSGAGEQEWVTKQLDKILAQAEKLIHLAPEHHDEDNRDPGKKPMGKIPQSRGRHCAHFYRKKVQPRIKSRNSWLQPSGWKQRARIGCKLAT
jgi:hypothetical protein